MRGSLFGELPHEMAEILVSLAKFAREVSEDRHLRSCLRGSRPLQALLMHFDLCLRTLLAMVIMTKTR